MSKLRLYNTLTRKKEDFVPLDPKNVRMYVCGPTVYDYAHIGNARPVIVFDVLFRLLKHLYEKDGGKVTYVRNITDVDDKINARAVEIAKEKKIPVLDAIRELTTQTAKQYEDDVTALGCLKPTHEPRATEFITKRDDGKRDMISLIKMLIENGHAYPKQGHVFYRVSSKPDYGKLSRRTLDEMIAGARVEVVPFKDDPLDFVLWKPSTPELPGWESPWGRGRPGWHIECSAMAEAYLGETFDIHGGGIDLLFPHHENEIAQSEGAHPQSHFARVWLHNGFLQVEGDKMSKSTGNFVTIRDLLKDWQGEVLRLAMLMTHYTQPINWTRAGLAEARKIWQEFALEVHDVHAGDVPSELINRLNDDLNTPSAISYLHHLKDRSRAGSRDASRELSAGLLFLGLIRSEIAFADFVGSLHLTASPTVIFEQVISKSNGDAFVRSIFDGMKSREYANRIEPRVFIVADMISRVVQVRDIRELGIDAIFAANQIDARNAARKAKNFKEADRIRDELEAKGIILKDNSDGTTNWEVKR